MAAASQPTWRGWMIMFAVALSTAALVPAGRATAQDAVESGGAVSTWRVVADDRAVDVEIVYDRFNDLDRPVGGVFETLPSTAIDVSAVSAAGGALDLAPVSENGDFTDWFVVFVRPVVPGAPLSWTLRYRIPSDPPDAVVHAFVDAAVVYVSSFAVDETRSGGAVRHRIELPVEYELSESSAFGDLTVIDDLRIVESLRPLVVHAENDAERGTPVSVEGETDLIFSPLPSDPKWSAELAARVEGLVVALEAVFGAPLSFERVVIVEVPADTVRHTGATRLLEGGIGAETTMPADVTDHELAHQLAHLWLLDAGIGDPWFAEGLAQALVQLLDGQLLEADLDGSFDAEWPTRADLSAEPGRLVDWVVPASSASLPVNPVPDADAAVAALLVVAPVLDEIGIEAMRDVIATLSAATITYVGRPAPEGQPIEEDWRVILDALTEIGGSELAADLFAELVVGDGERPLLDQWRAGRATWGELAERAEGWTMPLSLRRPMAAWDFGAVTTAAAGVEVALDRRDQVVTIAGAIDLGVPEPVRDAFELAADAVALDEVSAMLEAQIDEAVRIVAVVGASEADDGLLADVGLLGEDPDGDLERVIDLWTTGETAAAANGADELADLLDGAAGRGTLRIIVPAGVVALAIAAVVGLHRRRRAVTPRSRRTTFPR